MDHDTVDHCTAPYKSVKPKGTPGSGVRKLTELSSTVNNPSGLVADHGRKMAPEK